MATINLKVYAKYQRLIWKYGLYKRGSAERSVFDNVMRSLAVVYGDFFPADALRLGLDKQYNSLVGRRKRYRKRLRDMLFKYGDLYLVSLTFTDEVLNSSSFDTRKKYVQRWCKDSTLDYFGCVDFGKLKQREHYHIICALDIDFTYEKHRGKMFLRFSSLDSWSYGFSSCRSIKSSVNDGYRSLNYAFKSAMYSFKSSDSVYKPFHSRGVDYSVPHSYSHANDFFF